MPWEFHKQNILEWHVFFVLIITTESKNCLCEKNVKNHQVQPLFSIIFLERCTNPFISYLNVCIKDQEGSLSLNVTHYHPQATA